MKRTLIINHKTFENVGGIEKSLYNYAKYMIDHEGRVIWICLKNEPCAKSFANVMLDPRVERVHLKSKFLSWYTPEPIKFSKDEEVVIVSCIPMAMAQAESLVRKYPEYNITPFYAMANTTGKMYFLERFFSGWLKRKIQKRLSQVFERWESTNHIRFYAEMQADALEKNYGITVSEKKKKQVRPAYGRPELDIELLKKRARRESFNIATVGRFDFPHKGYMLGLVRSYGRLKKKYPQLSLTIMGFGPDEAILKGEISRLPVDFQKDVKLTGEVSPDELNLYFKDSHLNIGVAGGVGAGAMLGVPSLMARNFCEGECEVYGYPLGSVRINASSEPGKPVEPFIEEAINMGDAEYRKLAEDCYATYGAFSPDPWYYFSTKEMCTTFIVDNKEIRFFKWLDFMKKIILLKESIMNHG